LQSVDPGFDPRNALTMEIVVPDKQFTDATQEKVFFDQAFQRVRALPGVEAVGAIDDLPLIGGSNQPVAFEGRPVVQLSEQPEVQVRVVTPGYMTAMRIPVKRGRDLNESDTKDAPAAVLISESMAKQYWPNEDALGKRLTLSFYPGTLREVVGIVGDVKQEGLDVHEDKPSVYYPLAQDTPPAASIGGKWRPRNLWLVARTSVAPGTVIQPIQGVIHEMNHELPVRNAMTMEAFIADSLQQQHFSVILLGCFAGLAVVLAALGMFSVLSYSVRRRVREIGIRMALGAQVRDVLRLIVYEGMKPAFLGVVLGIIGALLLGRVLSKLMFGISATDPLTFVAVSVLLVIIAFLASLLPAYRATQVQPVRTLRDE
jgi:predicted permease